LCVHAARDTIIWKIHRFVLVEIFSKGTIFRTEGLVVVFCFKPFCVYLPGLCFECKVTSDFIHDFILQDKSILEYVLFALASSHYFWGKGSQSSAHALGSLHVELPHALVHTHTHTHT
jgi:hypothetical protein